MLRPWYAALALIIFALAWFTAFAWSVQLRSPDVLEGLADAADSVRFPAIAVSLHVRAAEIERAHVRRLREIDAPGQQRQEARFALADRLGSAAQIMRREGDHAAAEQLLTDALRAAPERSDLRTLLTDLRTRQVTAEERRVELLRLVYRHDDPLAYFLVGESFRNAGDAETAVAYLERAAERKPEWADPHLELARLYRGTGRDEDALGSAQQAFMAADTLGMQLSAINMIERSGGHPPERWRVIAEYAVARYSGLALLVAAFVVLLFSPALVSGGAGAVRRVRDRFQRSMPDSAS